MQDHRVKHFMLASVIALLLSGCSGDLFNKTANTPQARKAQAQHEQADQLSSEYLRCIATGDKQNPASLFHNDRQRRDVIFNDCANTLEKVSITVEQAFSNECLATPDRKPDERICDQQAVARGKRYIEKLQQEAAQHIHQRSGEQKIQNSW